jgi:uncharacterized membrane protein required for colicin V production
MKADFTCLGLGLVFGLLAGLIFGFFLMFSACEQRDILKQNNDYLVSKLIDNGLARYTGNPPRLEFLKKEK